MHDIGLIQASQALGRIELLAGLLHERVEGGAMRKTPLIGTEARVVGQVRAIHGLTEIPTEDEQRTRVGPLADAEEPWDADDWTVAEFVTTGQCQEGEITRFCLSRSIEGKLIGSHFGFNILY